LNCYIIIVNTVEVKGGRFSASNIKVTWDYVG